MAEQSKIFRIPLSKCIRPIVGLVSIGTAAVYSHNSQLWMWQQVSWCDGKNEKRPAVLKEHASLFGWISGTKEVTMSDGSRYVGTIVGDKRHGKGESWEQKGHYKGGWIDNVKCGLGIYNFTNGFVYDGTFSNDLPNGLGKITLRDGNVLAGEFVNGVLQGQPRVLSLPTSQYEGDVLNGEAHGFGTMTFKSGEVWEGEFCESALSGHGKITFSDGEVKEGQFKNGGLNGMGIVTFTDGVKAEGMFVDDNMHGVVKWTGGGFTYEANYVNDERIGPVRFELSGGRKAEGEMVAHFPHGRLKITCPDGMVFVGNCEYGMMVGRWEYIHPDCTITTEDCTVSKEDRVLIEARKAAMK